MLLIIVDFLFDGCNIWFWNKVIVICMEGKILMLSILGKEFW